MVIFEAKFTNPTNWEGQDDLVPVLAQIGENCFEIATNEKAIPGSWQILDKLLYFHLDGIGHQKLLEETSAGQIYNHSGEILFSTDPNTFGLQYSKNDKNAIKVAKELYMKAFDSSKKQLMLMQRICAAFASVPVRLFVCEENSVGSSEFKKELAACEKKLEKGVGKKTRFKKGKLVCAHINGLILSDKEKLVRYVRQEFDKKVLIGDIALDEKQLSIVKEITTQNVHGMKLYKSKWPFCYELVFALGLVRFAMKHYNNKGNGEFWPPFAKEFDYRAISPKEQETLNNFFERITFAHKKAYSNLATSKIDNVTMHCFVSDASANSLFDYLFAFWRLDLQRNIENLDTPEGEEAFGDLLREMQKGNQAIRSHTALLLKVEKPKSTKTVFKNRIKRILRLMHYAFWDEQKIPATGNRINALLETWMEQPKGAFLKEKEYVHKKGTFTKGEILFHHPVLRYEANEDSFSLVLPFQRLVECNEEDEPIWCIKSKDGRFEEKVKPEFGHDKIGFYLEKDEVSIPSECLLSEFAVRLESHGKELKKYAIPSSSIRFFDKKGRHVNHRSALIPEGFVSAFSDSESYPQILGMDSNPRFDGSLWVREFEVEKGDVVLLDGGYGLQVAQTMKEGLCAAQPLSGCSLLYEDEPYSLYRKLPKILVEAGEAAFKGVSLVINGKQNNVSSGKYEGFKLPGDLKTNGYLIDLSDYIQKEGFYKIVVVLPGHLIQCSCSLAFLKKEFGCRFAKANYIFEQWAKVLYRRSDIKEEKGTGAIWQKASFGEGYCEFNFAQKDDNQEDFCCLVEDDSIVLQYAFAGGFYPLSLKIPALYWRFSLDGEWQTGPLPELYLKDLNGKRSKLYVKGPFDFASSYLTTTSDIELAEEESQVYCTTGKNPYFDLSRVYGWFYGNDGAAMRRVYLNFKDARCDLADVACKGIVRSVSLLAFPEKGTIHGMVDILGDESYTATVWHDGKPLCEDEPIEDGRFSFDSFPDSGDYEISIYGISEDENGFDFDTNSTPLCDKPLLCKVNDLRHIEGSTIRILGVQDKDKETRRIEFKDRYLIQNLVRVSYEELSSEKDFALEAWEEDSDVDASGFIFYRGLFGRGDSRGNIVNFKHDVLLAFADPFDLNSMILLSKNLDGSGYESVFVDCNERQLDFHKEVRMKQDANRPRPSLILYDERYLIAELIK